MDPWNVALYEVIVEPPTPNSFSFAAKKRSTELTINRSYLRKGTCRNKPDHSNHNYMESPW